MHKILLTCLNNKFFIVFLKVYKYYLYNTPNNKKNDVKIQRNTKNYRTSCTICIAVLSLSDNFIFIWTRKSDFCEFTCGYFIWRL